MLTEQCVYFSVIVISAYNDVIVISAYNDVIVTYQGHIDDLLLKKWPAAKT